MLSQNSYDTVELHLPKLVEETNSLRNYIMGARQFYPQPIMFRSHNWSSNKLIQPAKVQLIEH